MTKRIVLTVIGTMFSFVQLGILFVEEPTVGVTGFYVLFLNWNAVYLQQYWICSAIVTGLAACFFAAALNNEGES